VRDGETVVLGGLITNSRIESEEQVPVLGDVPILGLLFRSQAKRDVQSNLVFFIRPRILTSLERGGTRLIVPPPDSGGGRIVTPPPRGEGGG
jgi:type II secretory pathway component GspD/PulD (secretin)